MKDLLTTIRRRLATARTTTKFALGVAAGALAVLAIARALDAGPDRGRDALAADSSARPDVLAHGRRFEEEVVTRTNRALDRAFGAGRAYVVVSSEWSSDEVETHKETFDPRNKVVVSETTSRSTTAKPASETAAVGRESVAPFEAPILDDNALSESTQTQKSSLVGRESESRRSVAPALSRLTVALFLDESLKSRAAEMESCVKASVGFDARRGDVLGSIATPLADLPRDSSGAVVGSGATSRLGVAEFLDVRALVLALALVVAGWLAWTWVRRVRADARRRALEIREAEARDPRAVVARARDEVLEFARADPARVGSILSRWAVEDETARTGGS